MKTDEEKLDNPVYHSLTETHQDYAIDYRGMKFYHPDYCPFGGFTAISRTKVSMDAYAIMTDIFYVVGEQPHHSEKLQLAKTLVCEQMLLDKPVDIEITEPVTELRTAQHENDLFHLVNFIQPGYFRNKTSQLGSYFGIYKNDKLVAAAGERMKMNAYTEVSAIVTHPDHTGKGYAKQLAAHVSNRIFSQNKTPYLHVVETNRKALGLYKKLGFASRRKISFWKLIKKD